MSETELYDKPNRESFLQYGNEKQPPPIVVVVGDGRSRVRRVVRTATRHVTVVSYSTRHKETRTHTSHHVTTVSFPQKAIDRNDPTQYGIAAPQAGQSSAAAAATAASSMTTDGGGGGGGNGNGNSSSGGIGGGGGYVYLQQHYGPSSNSSSTINYPIATQQPHMIYQHHAQQYPGYHQQQLMHQPGGLHYSQHVNPHHHHQHHHHIVHGHHHHHHHGGAVVIAGSGVGTGMGGGGGGSGNGGGNGGGTSPSAMQQNLHKKNSIRNGNEVLKRSRAQTAYELSQDLLEKKIELLERKYGGVRARNAAITIQRAFRHYMMVKKFASITAMAKAEKRMCRRTMVTASPSSGVGGEDGGCSLSSAYGSATESQIDVTTTQASSAAASTTITTTPQQQQQQQPRVTIMAGPPGGAGSSGVGAIGTATTNVARTPPTRSLSMRERRQLDGSPIPRSQSGVSATSSTGSSGTLGSGSTHHPHVNLLHAAEPHLYNSSGTGGATGHQVLTQYYTSYHGMPHELSFVGSNTSSHLDSSSVSLLNSSWVSANVSSTTSASISPHSPYYSATQIYMRPKGTIMPVAERKKVPPEVPKRTSSITAQQQQLQLQQQQQQQMLIMRQTPPPTSMLRSNGLCKTSENGSLTSVQSSGSDSSVTSTERIANSDLSSDRSNSPHTWKRGTALNSSQQFAHNSDCGGFVAAQAQATVATAAVAIVGVGTGSIGSGNMSVTSDDHAISSHTSAAQYEQHEQQDHQLSAATTTQNFKVSETIRKRQYRVGLNLFNKKPEKGITYLIRRGFLENTPQGVARFLITRKGLSRQMIGEYLGNLQNQFNMAVLNCFAMELDLSGMQVDVALRKFQAYFRMPGEAQKIERLMEVFSQRYCQCNQDIVGRLRSSDTIFVLAFAIIMLNTDLHTPNLKPERRMRVEDFIKNLRGIDDCHDIDRDMLGGIYERVKANEFKPGSDHVTQVMKVQATIVGKKPNLALPHRRLVCYCRLYEIPDINKKERPGVHQREVFLFNDLLVITKIFSKKKSSVTYTFRTSFPLCGMVVSLLDVTNYPFCIQLSQKVDGKILITFNARNEHDRCKFAEDLKESISEMDEMEALRIEAELERQKSARNRATGSSENRDSGVADVEVCPCPFQASQTGEPMQNAADSAQQLKRSALSNSLLDMHEQFGNDKPQRRGSVGSLDSGMSISFQSTTASSASRENAAVMAAAAAANAAAAKMRLNIPNSITSASIGGVTIGPGPGPAMGVYATSGGVAGGGGSGGLQNYSHGSYVHPSQHAIIMQHPMFQQQQQQQQQPLPPQQQHAHVHVTMQPGAPQVRTGSGRERKLSRTDDNGRSTEV